MMTTNQILEKLIETGGALITSDSCHPAEIAIARATDNFALHGDYGLVLKPKRWVTLAQESHRQKMDDVGKNILFRDLLQKHGVGGPLAYEWNNGDPLFIGDPITGRANSGEQAAIEAMKSISSVT